MRRRIWRKIALSSYLFLSRWRFQTIQRSATTKVTINVANKAPITKNQNGYKKNDKASMIGMTQRKRIKDKKPTIRSRYPRSPAQLVKFHVGKNKNHSHHYFWHLCFDVVVKLVPLCLDLCTNWLIIKCTPNINLFYIIVLIQFIYKISKCCFPLCWWKV